MSYEEVKRKLADVTRCVMEPASLSDRKVVCDAAAASGATATEIVIAVGGKTAFNAFVRALKKEGLA